MIQPTSDALVYDIKETSLLLKISHVTVRRLVKKGVLRPSRYSQKLLFPREELERFVRDTQAVLNAKESKS